MGLGLGLAQRNAFLDKYGARFVVQSLPSLAALLVVVDVSATCRTVVAQIKAQKKKHTVTPVEVGTLLHRKMLRWHPSAKEVVWVFDSYADLPSLRHQLYKTSRYRPATERQLAAVVPERQVVVGGRIYNRKARPYTPADVAGWEMNTEIDGERVFNSGAAKCRFYELVTEQLICVSAEHPTALVSIIDTMRPSGATNAVVTVVTSGGDGVTYSERPRSAKHGEADQKIAHLFSTRPDKGASGVWHTCDCDSIGQSVCNGLQPRIVFPGPSVVEPSRLPQGQSCAMALLCNGGDYNESMKYAQVSSENLFETLASCPSGITFVELGPAGATVDVRGIVEFLGAFQPKRRKRSVYVVEGEEPHKFYRMKPTAAEASSGAKVRQALPTGSMLSHSIADLVRAIVYWQMGATENSSDFGMMPELYTGMARSFRDGSMPTNVENMRESLDPTAEPVLVRFPI